MQYPLFEFVRRDSVKADDERFTDAIEEDKAVLQQREKRVQSEIEYRRSIVGAWHQSVYEASNVLIVYLCAGECSTDTPVVEIDRNRMKKSVSEKPSKEAILGAWFRVRSTA